MGGDPVTSEPVPTRGVAGARGGSRGRCRGDILGNCSYSRAGSRGCDGGGVFGGVPYQLTIARVCLVYYYQSAIRITVFRLVLVCSLCLLVGEMEGKECEREEN